MHCYTSKPLILHYKPHFSSLSVNPQPWSPHSQSLSLFLARPEKDGTATGVDAVCTLHSDPLGLQLDREKMYWELSHNTQGVTKLGSFTLEKDSLYINGEHPFRSYELKLRMLC